MDALVKFDQYIAQKGLRDTLPRRHVAEVFLRTERHISAQELYDVVVKKHPRIGYATVSRTLKFLVEAGLCREIDFGEGLKRYEHLYGHEHHDHLICTGCGKVVEIFAPEIEQIQARLVKAHGFVEDHHRLDIYGKCGKCQGKK